jgi:hypothetical protein
VDILLSESPLAAPQPPPHRTAQTAAMRRPSGDEYGPPPPLRRPCSAEESGIARRRERRALALLVACTVLFFTRQALLVPLTVGWPAARMLVQHEQELSRMHAQAEEYRSAARYFRTATGRDYARKLMYNQREPGEQRMEVQPQPDGEGPGLGTRMGTWVAGAEASLDRRMRTTGRVLHQWFLDPPALDSSPAPTPPGTPPGRP